MDISTSVASSSTHMEKGSNCSDSDSDIAEPPSKMACRELIRTSTKKGKNWKNEFSWLVYDEDINSGVFFRVCKQTTAEGTTQQGIGSHVPERE